MPSLLPGYEYDVFISYRQNDNRSGWVTDFVRALQEELAATIKEPVSVYFDSNPYDGLLEMHHVDKSLEGKLKCLVFVPILSQTYCDTKSFAWQHEFCAFNRSAKTDSFGREITLTNGNVASRILPLKIHDLDPGDKTQVEHEIGGVLRAIEFIYKEPGVNRPLKASDSRTNNLNKTDYGNQVNKVANAIKEILLAIHDPATSSPGTAATLTPIPVPTVWQRAMDRGLVRVALVYMVFAAVVFGLVRQASENKLFGPDSMTVLFVLIILGFPLAIWLAWRYEFSPGGIIRTSTEASSANPYSSARKKPFTNNVTLAILLVLLIAQVALFAPNGKSGSKDKSIAVLYFDNISNDPDQEPVADGITEEITAHLSQLRDIRVTSRTSVLPYKGKGKAKNIRQMAEELGVDNILEGSVRKSGNKLRITAQLIEATTDKHLWSEVYDRDFTDIFAIQSEIARAIANKFQVRITSGAQARMDQIPTRNMEAYNLYLKARSLPLVSGGGIGTYYGTVQKGIGMLKKAIELDPDFGEAHVQMGLLYAQLERKKDSAIALIKDGIITTPTSVAGFVALSELTGQARWLRRVYSLDTVAGLISLANILQSNGAYPWAVRCNQEAHRKAPNLVNPLVNLAQIYFAMGVDDSVFAKLAIAKTIDPKSREILELEKFMFYLAPEEYQKIATRYYGDDSLSYYKSIGVSYLFNRQWKEAEAAYAKTNYRDMDLGLVMLKTGRLDSGRTILQQALDYQLAHSGWSLNLARIYAALGNRSQALDHYHRLFARELMATLIRIDPFTDYIRNDYDFKKLENECKNRIQGQLDQIRQDASKPFDLEEQLRHVQN